MKSAIIPVFVVSFLACGMLAHRWIDAGREAILRDALEDSSLKEIISSLKENSSDIPSVKPQFSTEDYQNAYSWNIQDIKGSPVIQSVSFGSYGPVSLDQITGEEYVVEEEVFAREREEPLYRGSQSRRSPQEVFRDGFRLRSDFRLPFVMHIGGQPGKYPTQWISTSRNAAWAASFSGVAEGYVYEIWQPGGVDVNEVLARFGKKATCNEEEVLFSRPISGRFIKGAYPVVKMRDWNRDPGSLTNLRKVRIPPASEMISNPNFDPSPFPRQSALSR